MAEVPNQPPEGEPQSTPAAAPLPSPISQGRRLFMYASPLLLMFVAWGSGYFAYKQIVADSKKVSSTETVTDGAQLYVQHCAQCHGITGDGNGVANLYPKARHFGAEKFKLVSTNNSIPTDQDLTLVLRRGIPGTAMPDFKFLNDQEIQALIGHIRELTWNGLYDKLRKKAIDDGDFDPIDVADRTTKMTAIGTPMTVPPQSNSSNNEVLAQGKKVYIQNCAPCHGNEGRGDGPQVKDLKNENGTPSRPRDLTAGVFKGGREREHLYARIVLGIPGTPMPASNALKPEDVDALIHFVYSIAPVQPASNGSIASR